MKRKNLSIKDLAQILKLSPAAVSQALNGNASTIRISEATKRRVQRAAKKHGYRSNRMARSLRTGRSDMIGVIAMQSQQQINFEHLHYASYYAREHGCIPLIQEISLLSREEVMRQAVDVLLDAKVDACILALLPEFPLVDLFQEAGISVVSISMPAMTHGIPKYYPDKTRGFQLMAEHLLEQGNFKITYVGEGHQTYCMAAQEGLRQAIQAAQNRGLEASWNLHSVDLHFHVHVAKTAETLNVHPLHLGGYLGLREIIQSKKLPDAVICSNDNWAQGALLACAEAGVRVPHDIAIAGFDNDSNSSAGMLPLSSVGQPIQELYRLAFNDLKQAQADKTQLTEKATILPCELFLRASTLHNKAPRKTR